MYIQHKNLSRLPVTAIERAERIDTLLENERALMREIIIGGHATETRMVLSGILADTTVEREQNERHQKIEQRFGF